MTLANEVKREYPMKALFDSFVAGKRLAVDEVREALSPSADFKAQLDQAMELVLMLVAANQELRKALEFQATSMLKDAVESLPCKWAYKNEVLP